MPNLASLYSNSAGRKELLETQQEITPDGTLKSKEQKKASDASENAARKSAKHSWLNSTITQEVMKDLRARELELIDSAIQLAINHPTDMSHDIIAKLVRVSEIRELINKVKE